MRAGITISVWESIPKYVIVVSDRKETKCMCENVYDMIIVGSGPAGLTAGIYGKRAGLKVVILESGFIQGGQIVNTYEVDNYPGMPGISGLELAEKLKEHVTGFGVEIARGKVKGISLDGEWKIVHTKKAEFRGHGVAYCATCDGAFFKDKTVAVVGGGDVAVEDAIFLARGCKQVYLIHRRDQLRAAQVLQDALKDFHNITCIWDTTVEKIGGEQQVQWITLKQTKTAEKYQLDVDGVFIAVGTVPDTGFVKELVDLDEHGYIKAGEDGRTGVSGIYAAGDIRTKELRQIITAAADGANCVNSAQQDLYKG